MVDASSSVKLMSRSFVAAVCARPAAAVGRRPFWPARAACAGRGGILLPFGCGSCPCGCSACRRWRSRVPAAAHAARPYLAAIFWVNHIGMPLVTRAEAFSFLEHQVVTSRTIVNPPRWHWVFGGLNFQVEHHLFPMVPSRRLAAVQPVVQRHLQGCGLPYCAVTWPAAVRAIHGHLRAVARST